MLNPMIVFALAFALTLVFGFWLSRKGKPYNGALFNAHKLLALGAVIVFAFQLYTLVTTLAAPPLVYLFAAFGAFGVIGLFGAGALMSAEKFDYARLRNIHRLALGIVLVALAGSVLVFSGMQT